MTDGTDAHRVTNQELGRRVGSLEEAVGEHGDRLHELSNELTVVRLQVEHSQALQKAKFEQLISSTATNSEQLARLIENRTADSLAASDLDASPVGRSVKAQLEALEAGRKVNAAAIAAINTRIAQAVAILAAIGFLVPILAPLVQNAIGVPT